MKLQKLEPCCSGGSSWADFRTHLPNFLNIKRLTSMIHVKQIQQIRKLLANFENETMNCSSASSSQRNGFNAMNASIASGFLCAAPVQLISPLVFPE